MTIGLTEYLAAQDRAVIAAFADDGWCICAATSLAELEDLARLRGRTVAGLAGFQRHEAAVLRHAGHAELWCWARLPSYRRAFKAFAFQEYGFAFDAQPAGTNVDHLFSKERTAPAGDSPAELADARLPHSTMVRMLLVDAKVNKSFGGLMEKDMVATGNPNRPVRRFTYLQLAKALSIAANADGRGLAGNADPANFIRLAQAFAARGVLAALGFTEMAMIGELMREAAKVQHYRTHPARGPGGR